MSSKNFHTRVFVAVIAIQLIATIVIAVFAIAFFFYPDSNSAFKSSVRDVVQGYANTLSPIVQIGQTGASGEQGIQGPKGDQGQQGPAGPSGSTGSAGNVGPTGQTGATGEQGPKGDQGVQGEKGDPGPVASWRCDTTTSRWQYKYPADDDWSTTSGACIPMSTDSNLH